MDDHEIESLQQAKSIIRLQKLEIQQKDQLIAELKSVISDLTKISISKKSVSLDKHSPTKKTISNTPTQQTPFKDKTNQPISNDSRQEKTPQNNQHIPNESSQGTVSKTIKSEPISSDQPISKETTNIKLEPIVGPSTSSSTVPKPLKSKKNHPKKRKRANWYEKKRVCKGCNEVKKLKAKELCQACYSRAKKFKKRNIIGECKECNELKSLYCGQTCTTCYGRRHSKIRKPAECKNCKKVKILRSGGLCKLCYLKSQPKRNCLACGDLEQIYAKDMCSGCYRLNRPESICENCKQTKIIRSRNMCDPCYLKVYVKPKKTSGNVKKEELSKSKNSTIDSFLSTSNANNSIINSNANNSTINSNANNSAIECVDIVSDSDN